MKTPLISCSVALLIAAGPALAQPTSTQPEPDKARPARPKPDATPPPASSTPAAKPAAKPATKPAAKTAAKTATKTATRTATKPATKPATKTPTGPVLQTRVAGGKVVVWLKAQLRDRFETHGRKDLNPDTRSELISQRARLGIGARLFQRFSVFVQLQDVRIWGEENNTLGDYTADGFDVHQAWGLVRIVGGLHLKIGRQEIAWDDHRLLGTVNWTQQARSFDALRLWYAHKLFRAEAIYARLAEKQDGSGETDADRSLLGFHFELRRWKLLRPTALYLGEIDWDGEVTRHRHTLGARLPGKWKGLSYALTFYYQLGEQGDVDIAAYLFAARVGYLLEKVVTKPGIALWADLLSGDRDAADSTVRAFDTLYATNHKFYGFMDYFLNIGQHAGGRGLQDFGARLHLSPARGLWAAVDYHLLRLMIPDAAGDQGLAHELDVTVRYALLKWVQLQAGYSVLVPLAALTTLKGGQDGTDHWFYLQTNIAF